MSTEMSAECILRSCTANNTSPSRGPAGRGGAPDRRAGHAGRDVAASKPISKIHGKHLINWNLYYYLVQFLSNPR